MPYRILSLDAGGMRGLISVLLLQRLQERVPALIEGVDLIAGTSTGALIALGLAAELPLERLRNLYEQEGQRIFADSPLDDLVDLGRLLGAEYDSAGLEEVLRELFGALTLSALRKRVLIPAFDLDSGDQREPGAPRRRWKAKLMHNFPGSDSDGEVPVWLAGMRSAAAPTYFPSSDGFIDGAVFAANPALCALAQTQDRRALPDPPLLSEVSLLSIGTGELAQFLPGSSHDWGAAQWGRALVEIFMSGTSEVASYQCRAMLGERFARLSPRLERSDRLRLDSFSPGSLATMHRVAARMPLENAVSWLEEFW